MLILKYHFLGPYISILYACLSSWKKILACLKSIIHLQKLCETAPFWKLPKSLPSALLMYLLLSSCQTRAALFTYMSVLPTMLLTIRCRNGILVFFVSPVCSTAMVPQKLSSTEHQQYTRLCTQLFIYYHTELPWQLNELSLATHPRFCFCFLLFFYKQGSWDLGVNIPRILQWVSGGILMRIWVSGTPLPSSAACISGEM